MGGDMSTYLVIAHQTALSYELEKALNEVVQKDAEAEFVLLVPATPAQFLNSPPVGSFRNIARGVAKEASRSLQAAGFKVRWTVIGDQSPLVAMDTEVKDHPEQYAGIIISTFAEGRSRWLDLQIMQAAESLSLTLIHVVEDQVAPSPFKAPQS
jgi:hypothetical protein